MVQEADSNLKAVRQKYGTNSQQYKDAERKLKLTTDNQQFFNEALIKAQGTK